MDRIIIVYNPRSSRFGAVRSEVLDKLSTLRGYLVGKYEVEPTDADKNSTKLAKILKDGDLVVSVGGDATGVIASNAILKSGKSATLTALPYGNFNDLARTLGTKTLLSQGPVQKYYPLEILINGKFFRYSTCYVTIGMTAEATKIYDTPKLRQKLKTSLGRRVGSYVSLASWYFKHRHDKPFLPEFSLNGTKQPLGTSDYFATNGLYVARVMKGRPEYQNPNTFYSTTGRLTNFWQLFKFMAKSILFRIPSTNTTDDLLKFTTPTTITIQTEGEYKILHNVTKIKIRKSQKYLKTITATSNKISQQTP